MISGDTNLGGDFVGTAARKIVNLDIDELVKRLNKALADEWLAYYQYWMGAKLARGQMLKAVADELEEHAEEELKHAGMLVDRIIQLGGTPLLKPEDWYKETNCGYDAPEKPDTKTLLEQNIKGERCAIAIYNDLLNFIGDKDPVTYDLVLAILKDELEHEDDLEKLLKSMEV